MVGHKLGAVSYTHLDVYKRQLSAGLEASGADSANFLNLMKNGDGSNNIVSVISGLGWGLGYFGMPHLSLIHIWKVILLPPIWLLHRRF